MPGLKELCRDSFGKDDLYDVLGTTKEATEAELKKCYYRLSLRVHPDRVEEEEKEAATAKFQLLGRVYGILGDEEKRKIYDETGDDPDDDENDDFFNVNKDWASYWRRTFPAVTEEMIKNFYATYTDSDQEREDLKAFYARFDGDMEKILEWMIHRTEEDAERLQGTVEGMIRSGELEKTAAFAKTKLTKRKKTQRRKRAAEEAAEAEDMLKQIRKKHRVSEDASLEVLLKKRAEDRESLNGSFLEALEAKYCGGGGGGGESDDDDEDDVKPKTAKPKNKGASAAKAKIGAAKSQRGARKRKGR